MSLGTKVGDFWRMLASLSYRELVEVSEGIWGVLADDPSARDLADAMSEVADAYKPRG